MAHKLRIALAFSVAAFAASTLAAPVSDGSVSEQPLSVTTTTQLPQTRVSYGLCNGPQNADAWPSSPVPVTAATCENYQRYTATSAGPSTGGSCGGFTVAFGPLGDLNPNLDRVSLRADWGDTPLTEAQCAKARVAATGWGARCIDDACSQAEWEKIGVPKQRAGTWDSAANTCYIGLSFASTGKRYVTLNIDVITKLDVGGNWVRKRAKGTIRASKPNGKCLSATAR
jgi:hypothetical protein